VLCGSAQANTTGCAWGENTGWANFDPTGGGVTVYDDHLEGYVWAGNIGWIRLGTYTGGDAHTYASTTNLNYGVNNNGSCYFHSGRRRSGRRHSEIKNETSSGMDRTA
jgi:hypothetical protein